MGEKRNKQFNIKDVSEPPKDDLDKIRISFLKYSDKDKTFHPDRIQKSKYMTKFSERFRHICSLNLRILASGAETDEHNHIIEDWDKLNKPKDFHKIYDNNLEGYQWWQFSITKGANNQGCGRVFGFFEGNTYHIVWFDPSHKISPRK